MFSTIGRTDDEAFYALADRVPTEGVELQPLEHLTELIEKAKSP